MADTTVINEIPSAWLITWEFHAPEAKRQLQELGIKNRVIDVVDSHRDYEFIIGYTKEIYRLLVGEYSEKIALLKRGKQRLETDDYFHAHPVLTSYQTDLYQKLLKSSDDLDSEKHKQLLDAWGNHAYFVSVGHNPSILGRKVTDIKVLRRNGYSDEWLEWYDPYKKKNDRS